MRIIPSVYYNSKIIALITSLIEDGYQSYSDMPEIEQERLSALCIDVLGDDAYECIIETDDLHNTIHHLRQFLITGKREYALDLAITMSANATKYFADNMDYLFQEMIEAKQSEVYRMLGLRATIDNINGETQWA